MASSTVADFGNQSWRSWSQNLGELLQKKDLASWDKAGGTNTLLKGRGQGPEAWAFQCKPECEVGTPEATVEDMR